MAIQEAIDEIKAVRIQNEWQAHLKRMEQRFTQLMEGAKVIRIVSLGDAKFKLVFDNACAIEMHYSALEEF